MQLGSDRGPSIELKVLGYEFPQARSRKGSWDANWLNVAARVRLGGGRTWEFTHPCLDTFEAVRLGLWLQDLSDAGDQTDSGPATAGVPGPRLTFTEPLLAFEAETTSDDELVIRIILDLEALPPWVPWERWSEADKFVLLVPVDRQELRVAAEHWAEEVASFPRR